MFIAMTQTCFQVYGIFKTLLNGFGLTELVPESSMDAVTGMSGSGIAFVYQVIKALEDGGVGAGLSRDVASKFASQTALAAAKMIQQSDRDIQPRDPRTVSESSGPNFIFA